MEKAMFLITNEAVQDRKQNCNLPLLLLYFYTLNSPTLKLLILNILTHIYINTKGPVHKFVHGLGPGQPGWPHPLAELVELSVEGRICILIFYYIVFPPTTTEYTFFSSRCGTFSKIC